MSDVHDFGDIASDPFQPCVDQRVYDLTRRLTAAERNLRQANEKLGSFDECLRLVEERVGFAKDQSVLVSQRVDRLERAQPDAQAGTGLRWLVTMAQLVTVALGGLLVVSILAPAITYRASEWTTGQSLPSSRLALDDMPRAVATPVQTSPPMPPVTPFEATNSPQDLDDPISSATELVIERGLTRLFAVCQTADTSAGALFHARAKDYFNQDPCAFLIDHEPEAAKPAAATGAASLTPPVGPTDGVAVSAILPPSLQPLPR